MRYGDDEEPWYDVAQVCLNGHTITEYATASPDHRKDFCPKCGAGTVDSCPHCSAGIQGYYHVPGVFSFEDFTPPAFCHACGKPYPWTKAMVEAAQALAEEMAGLNESERILLKASIEDLVKDSPKTQVAIVRFKKLAARGGKEVVQAFRDILVDVVSETAKKAIWGG